MRETDNNINKNDTRRLCDWRGTSQWSMMDRDDAPLFKKWRLEEVLILRLTATDTSRYWDVASSELAFDFPYVVPSTVNERVKLQNLWFSPTQPSNCSRDYSEVSSFEVNNSIIVVVVYTLQILSWFKSTTMVRLVFECYEASRPEESALIF